MPETQLANANGESVESAKMYFQDQCWNFSVSALPDTEKTIFGGRKNNRIKQPYPCVRKRTEMKSGPNKVLACFKMIGFLFVAEQQ